MQTFLPYPDFNDSLACLDYRRLGKQRVEAKQILSALGKGSGGWYNHPATRMWAGHESALALYHDLAIEHWVKRGYNNTMQKLNPKVVLFPPWLGQDQFHSTHRAALLQKDFNHYSQFSWTESPKIEYIWPI